MQPNSCFNWIAFVAICWNTEFTTVVERTRTNSLSLDNNCASYERWSPVKVVSGRLEALTLGTRISGCSEIDITEFIKTSLPDAFISGSVLSHNVNLDGISITSQTCGVDAIGFFLAWNCSPSMFIMAATRMLRH